MLCLILYALGVALVYGVQRDLLFETDVNEIAVTALGWPLIPLAWLAFTIYERWFSE